MRLRLSTLSIWRVDFDVLGQNQLIFKTLRYFILRVNSRNFSSIKYCCFSFIFLSNWQALAYKNCSLLYYPIDKKKTIDREHGLERNTQHISVPVPLALFLATKNHKPTPNNCLWSHLTNDLKVWNMHISITAETIYSQLTDMTNGVPYAYVPQFRRGRWRTNGGSTKRNRDTSHSLLCTLVNNRVWLWTSVVQIIEKKLGDKHLKHACFYTAGIHLQLKLSPDSYFELIGSHQQNVSINEMCTYKNIAIIIMGKHGRYVGTYIRKKTIS